MKHNIQFTLNERCVVEKILGQVSDHMWWNSENDWYEDTGDIVIVLDRGEKRSLTSAMRKV